ncbi:MAG: Phosphinothricin N-acetyltransferase [Frankiales bacterium]|nr:Phosphinothricin N-acetyltransferase [Frankiales bacterium]
MQLRPALSDDAEAIAEVYRHYVESSLATFEEVPPTGAEMRRRMLLEPRLPWLVACEDVVVGYAYASHHRARAGYRWSADVSVYLAPQARGRGAGRALYEQLLAVLRDLGYVNAYAGIALPNAASVGLHEALGFRLVGVFEGTGFKHGQWIDVGWWQLRLRDRPTSPEEPRAVT